jgi:hypothetical protein
MSGPTTKPRTKPDVTGQSARTDVMDLLMMYISELYPGKSFRMSTIAALIMLLAIATPSTASAPIVTLPHLYDYQVSCDIHGTHGFPN